MKNKGRLIVAISAYVRACGGTVHHFSPEWDRVLEIINEDQWYGSEVTSAPPEATNIKSTPESQEVSL